MGHCTNYNTTCEIETAQAMRAQNKLPIIPNSDKDIVLTFFRVDNFDHIVDNQAGACEINTIIW